MDTVYAMTVDITMKTLIYVLIVLLPLAYSAKVMEFVDCANLIRYVMMTEVVVNALLSTIARLVTEKFVFNVLLDFL